MSREAIVESKSIATFAIIDLETNELPCYQFNQCAITELSICAFSVDCFNPCSFGAKTNIAKDSGSDGVGAADAPKVPPLPRVMHKLTLMVNPLRRISDVAEKLTGGWRLIDQFPRSNQIRESLLFDPCRTEQRCLGRRAIL